MSVPTKTGLQICNEINQIWTNKSLETLREKLKKQKWVLLEDHQKEIERRERLREQYYEGWLSPEQLEEKVSLLKDKIAKQPPYKFSKLVAFEDILEQVFSVGGKKNG